MAFADYVDTLVSLRPRSPGGTSNLAGRSVAEVGGGQADGDLVDDAPRR